MKTEKDRLLIAAEIVRRIDTVTLATCEEVDNIRRRALAGELDDIFNQEKT